MSQNPTVRDRIEKLVGAEPVILFMKGNRRFPQCGFSAQVVEVLDRLVPAYETVNVLADPEIREGIKEYSSWPTIPQLYVRGQFVGGCDIVKEMYASGELQKLLGGEGVSGAEVAAPAIKFSARASAEIGKAMSEAGPGEKLRVAVSPSFEHELYFDSPTGQDLTVDAGGVTVLVDPASARRANGLVVDFVEGPRGAGFKIENPNEPPRVRPLTAKELKARMQGGGAPVHVFDVRPEVERRIAKIAEARALDADGIAALEALPNDAPVVFLCHHGIRSRAAAEEAIRRGFTQVYNLEGGIDAWSADVDPSVPRY